MHKSLLLFLVLSAVSASAHEGSFFEVTNGFMYEKAGKNLPAEYFHSTQMYDSDIANCSDRKYIVYLEHHEGKGDQLCLSELAQGKLIKRTQLLPGHHQIRKPTLTTDQRNLYVSYEMLHQDNWEIFLLKCDENVKPGPPVVVSSGAGSNINHRVAMHTQKGLVLVWQKDVTGQFDIVSRSVRLDNLTLSEQTTISDSSTAGDWHPSLSVNPQGDICVAWDCYMENSFDVKARVIGDDGPQSPLTVASGPRAQFRADVSFAHGKFYVLWEEGGANWGMRYKGGFGHWTDIHDHHGPLHKLRTLHVATIDNHTVKALDNPFPMNALDEAMTQADRRKDANLLGLFYERGKFVRDAKGRLWVVYRHFFAPHVRTHEKVAHHTEAGWKVYARCFDGQHWSESHSFTNRQRDGMQRLSLASSKQGIDLTYTVGRTRRGKIPEEPGVVYAHLDVEDVGFDEVAWKNPFPPAALPQPVFPRWTSTKSHEVNGKAFQLFFGDLHRHTDLSLCFAFFDGTYDDNFRYAIEVVKHDFLAITDHCRDLNRGKVESHVWWRSIKEVTRHRLADRFFPYFSFERSRKTDHNVISLKNNILSSYNDPIDKYWAQLDGDSFTIPHNTQNSPRFHDTLWLVHDDEKRPLLEVYQGCRDMDVQVGSQFGLRMGYHFGFIASSDHLSTHQSYSCVWSDKKDRVSIFRAMQNRRAYAATDKIGLILTSGNHWMGEIVKTNEAPTLDIVIDGTAPIKWVNLLRNGHIEKRFEPAEESINFKRSIAAKIPTKTDYYYIHMMQTDGNQAWSSPIWFEVE